MADSGRRDRGVPRATYRIQFTPEFGFAQARQIVEYLHALGISHIYASPIFQARPGSQHGYDVVDPTKLSDQLGGEAEFLKLSAALKERGMSLLLDIVPNHMAAHPENRFWWDVLRRGRESEYAEWFDIDWERGGGKVIQPILGAPLEEVIAKGELRVEGTGDGAELRYYDQRFPLAAGTWASSADPGVRLRPTLDRQHYELAFWRDGGKRINYRRFFDVTELVAVRPEIEAQFQTSHELIARLVREGHASGLRVDHIDGLAEPGAYLSRLRGIAGGEDAYILVEKILAPHETMPDHWPVAGTTGYDTMNLLGALWVEPRGLRTMYEEARRRLGLSDAFEDEMYRGKRQVIDQLFPGDLRTLAERAAQELGASAQEFAPALAAITAALPVYRTYISAGRTRPEDREVLARAVADASRREPPLQDSIAKLADLIASPKSQAAAAFVRRWQQFSGPVMAKGVEDTAMYRHIVLTSLNEVGGHVDVVDDPVAAFHELCGQSAGTHPHRMNATSTHDTKRSEDVRARIAVLSEAPDQWHAALDRWTAQNAQWKGQHKGRTVPTLRDEALLYQSLIGAWPLEAAPDQTFTDRIQAYMLKAAKEAKLETSWIDPDEEYESALRDFTAAVLAPGNAEFLGDVAAFAERTAFYGALNSLSQTLLKLTMPGIPDTYQGSELWDLSLVDPDNRRPVDYDHRRETLAQLDAHDKRALESFEAALRDWPSGRVKLLLTRELLALRRTHAALFTNGGYTPLPTRGQHSGHIIAFARIHEDKTFIAAAGRLLTSMISQGELPASPTPWRDTFLEIPEELTGTYRDVLSGRVLDLNDRQQVSQLFARAPVAAWISAS